MSFVSSLTWKCIELQNIAEDPEKSEADKCEAVRTHLDSLTDDREPFPEFGTGWEWFNTKRALSVEVDFQDQITVVDFFTYCCINCMHILPDLHSLEEKYPTESVGVCVVGVHSAKFENEKVSANILAAIQRYGISHPVVNDSEAVLWKSLEITCWPTLLILGPDARPLFVVVGEGHRDVVFRYVDCAVKYYGERVRPRSLPLLLNSSEALQSHLLYPGKVCLVALPDQQRSIAVSDTGHHRILIASLQGEIRTVIGGLSPGMEDGAFDKAKFRNPQGLAFLPPNSLYVADTGNHSIRLVDLDLKTVRTVAGTGVQGTDKEGGKRGTEQSLASPWDVTRAPASDLLLIANAGTHQIWGLALSPLTWWKNARLETGQCVRLAGSGAEENRNNSYPTKAAFAQPSGLCCDDSNIYVADSESSSIRQVSLKDGSVKGVVGGDRDPSNLFCYGDKDNSVENPKGPVLLQHPLAVAWNPVSQLVYVADSYNHKVKVVDSATKVCTTVAGSGTAGFVDGALQQDDIQFNEPGGLCFDPEQNCLYVADTNNHCIRRLDLNRNTVETVKINATARAETADDLLAGAPDFQESAVVSPEEASFDWIVSFRCPEGWKWSEEAPHTWKTTLPDGVKKGTVDTGTMRMSLHPSALFARSEVAGRAVVRLHANLYLCALDSGICTKQSLTVQLNLQSGAKDGESDRVVRSEFVVRFT